MTSSQRQWLQLVRASHRYHEVTGSTPVEVLNCSGFYIRNCINCVHNCEDHSLLDLTSAVHYMKYFIYHFKYGNLNIVSDPCSTQWKVFCPQMMMNAIPLVVHVIWMQHVQTQMDLTTAIAVLGSLVMVHGVKEVCTWCTEIVSNNILFVT